MILAALASTSVRPFFLRSQPGDRFCLLHAPAQQQQPHKGGIVYVHPFAEEMNKSRRMAALQSRRLAALGYAVLQIDLFGCGDSSGDIADADLDVWLRDLDAAAEWLAGQGHRPLYLWGLRLGALLAAAWSSQNRAGLAGLLL